MYFSQMLVLIRIANVYKECIHYLSWSVVGQLWLISISCCVLQLIDRADKLSAERQSALNKPKSPRSEELKQFTAYLTTQHEKISEKNWYDYTMEAMALVRKYQGAPKMHSAPPVQQQRGAAQYQQHQAQDLPDVPMPMQ